AADVARALAEDQGQPGQPSDDVREQPGRSLEVDGRGEQGDGREIREALAAPGSRGKADREQAADRESAEEDPARARERQQRGLRGALQVCARRRGQILRSGAVPGKEGSHGAKSRRSQGVAYRAHLSRRPGQAVQEEAHVGSIAQRERVRGSGHAPRGSSRFAEPPQTLQTKRCSRQTTCMCNYITTQQLQYALSSM